MKANIDMTFVKTKRELFVAASFAWGMIKLETSNNLSRNFPNSLDTFVLVGGQCTNGGDILKS